MSPTLNRSGVGLMPMVLVDVAENDPQVRVTVAAPEFVGSLARTMICRTSITRSASLSTWMGRDCHWYTGEGTVLSKMDNHGSLLAVIDNGEAPIWLPNDSCSYHHISLPLGRPDTLVPFFGNSCHH